MLLALDPGKHCVGWALWGDGKLVACGLVRTKEKVLGDIASDLYEKLSDTLFEADDHEGHAVIVEKPRLYPRNKYMQPNDLIDLAFVGGAIAMVMHGSVEVVEPVGWKGQTPKDINHRRVIERLDRDGLLALQAGLRGVPESLKHNVLDAVGIGRWKVMGEKI